MANVEESVSNIQIVPVPDDPLGAVRVFIADRHDIVRAGLALEINRHADLLVVGEARHGAEVLQRVIDTKPDVLVLDINMPGMNGVQIIHRLYTEKSLQPPPRVLIFSAHRERQYVWSALAAGARGYLLKNEPPVRVIEAIHALYHGQVMLSAPVQSLLVGLFPLLQQELSLREIEVIRLLARGLADWQIAATLNITESTVRSHLNSIFRKVPLLRSRAEAITWAWVNQVVSE